jgi:hypothetical protein
MEMCGILTMLQSVAIDVSYMKKHWSRVHECVCARAHARTCRVSYNDHSGCYLKLSVHGESLKNVSFLYQFQK